jgi:hypothetical protein
LKKIRENIFMNCETLKKENNQLKQDLKAIDEIYIKLVQQLAATEVEKENLEEQLQAIEEDGTEEHNAAFDLRCKLAEALVEKDQWKDVAKKLYGVALHLQEVSKRSAVVVVGSGLYSEAVNAVKMYEKYESNS